MGLIIASCNGCNESMAHCEVCASSSSCPLLNGVSSVCSSSERFSHLTPTLAPIFFEVVSNKTVIESIALPLSIFTFFSRNSMLFSLLITQKMILSRSIPKNTIFVEDFFEMQDIFSSHAGGSSFKPYCIVKLSTKVCARPRSAAYNASPCRPRYNKVVHKP